MARRGRVRDDGVHAAEARRALAELEAVHECLTRLAAPVELGCEHPARASELALRQLVLGIALEPRVVDALGSGMAFEEAGDGQRVRAVAFHAERERLQAST